MSDDEDKTVALLHSHLSLAKDLCERCKNHLDIKGANKLLKKCQAELKFLNGLGVRARHELRECHLRSSNLASLEAVVVAMETLPGVMGVLQTMPWLPHPLVVDLVCNHGYTWVKVVARKAQALHLVWAGGGQFGEKNLVHQVRELVSCAKGRPYNFTIPDVLVIMTAGVTESLRHALCQEGVKVQAQTLPVDDETQRKLQMAADVSDDDDDEETQGAFGITEGGTAPAPEEGSEGRMDGLNVIQVATHGALGGNCSSTSSGSLDHSPPPPSPAIQLVSYQSINYPSAAADTDVKTGVSMLCVGKEEEEEEGEEKEKKGMSRVGTVRYQQQKTTGHIRQLMSAVVSNTGSSNSSSRVGLEVVERVNLDITTLIALVSAQCHGRANFVFREDVLTGQAARERASPVLPRIKSFLYGKQVLACETAVQDFKTILATVAGPMEKQRADSLLSSITIVPDQPSARTLTLHESAKIKNRAKAVFGTGDELQAVTITANVGFIRAAQNQGVSYTVFMHEPRALTEQKEAMATPLSPSPASTTEPSSAASTVDDNQLQQTAPSAPHTSCSSSNSSSEASRSHSKLLIQ